MRKTSLKAATCLLACLFLFSQVGPVATASASSCKSISERTWKFIKKSPSKYKGRSYVIWGNITQFDGITGPTSFLATASSANKMMGSYFDSSDFAFFAGTAKRLSRFVEGDVFKACATMNGTYSYERAIGGTVTVPLLKVKTISYRGSTD